MNKLILNSLFLIILLVILIYYLKIKKILEHFSKNKHKTDLKNDYYPGSYINYFRNSQLCNLKKK